MFDITHFEFLLGILANLGNPGTAGLDIVLTDMLNSLVRQVVKSIVVKDELVSPCPLIDTVVVVNLVEASKHIGNTLDIAVLDVADESLFLAVRQQQTAEVVPTAQTSSRSRTSQPSALDGAL